MNVEFIVVKKRRHHYVWQKYLRAWSVDDQIACLRNGRTFRSGTVDVAVRKDFYRLKEITPSDLEVIKLSCFDRCELGLRTVNQRWIPLFTMVFEVKRRYEASGRQDARVAQALDEAISNLEEDLHTGIEIASAHQLDALRRDDLSFLASDDELATFVHYLGVQYMRTAKMRAECLAAMSRHALPGFDAARAWGLFSHVFATNIGAALYRERRRLGITLLKTAPGSELIAADQPVINLRTISPGGGRADELELYYPIGPTAALLIDPNRRQRETKTLLLKFAEADAYNRALLAQAHEQSYATNEALLRSYVS
jgi:hypothetical protein